MSSTAHTCSSAACTRNSNKTAGPLSRGLTTLIRGYQLYISPLFGPHCRYYPSCSEYARQAFINHGPLKGFRLAAGRIVRCNPFSYGGVDPVPEAQACSCTNATANSSNTQ